MIEFADPWAFGLLFAPFLVRILFKPMSGHGRVLRVPAQVAQQMMAGGKGAPSFGGGTARRLVAPALLWGLIVLALAGPRMPEPVRALQVSGRDLAIALDLSGSMVREDFVLDGQQVRRLDAVAKVGAAFVRRRGGDRVGLILFGSSAYFAAPLTYDVEAVAERIEQAVIGIPGRATNISDGLGLALKRMEQSTAETRVVILLSDGANNAGAADPLAVARLAAEKGVRVHTIALGPKDETTAAHGERGVVHAATLQAMAKLSGGEAFRVRTTQDLEEVARAIDRLEATDRAGLAAEVYRDLWIWPAAVALALALVLQRREVW